MTDLSRKQAEIANRIRFLLEKSGMSQKELGEKSGLKGPSISAILRGQRNLTLLKIVALETALGAKIMIAAEEPAPSTPERP